MTEQTLIEAAISGAKPSSTGWFRVKCPFCVTNTGKADKKGSLAVSATTGNYRCWKCPARGRVDLEYHGDVMEFEPPPPSALQAPDGFLPLVEGDRWSTALCLREPIDYLRRRLGPRAGMIARDVGVGACLSGKRAGRIIVPVTRGKGPWVGWVGRDFTGQMNLPYVYPAGMTRVLFNEGALYEDKPEHVLVVEGVFDALPYWPNVVACLGKPSKWQVMQMQLTDRALVVALDGDAWEEGWALAAQLKFTGKEAVALRLPPSSDPGSIDPHQLQELAIKTLNHA